MTASSTSVTDPVGRAGVVVDGDPATAWSPAATDRNPLLRLAWEEPRVIEGLRVSLPFDVAATRPATIRVVGDDGVRGGFLYEDGVVAFDPPMRTDEVTIMILDPPRALSFEPYTNTLETLPIAVGEVTVLPLAGVTPPNLGARIDVPCGGGPTLEAGGRRIQTRFTATVRDLLQLREVAATPCAVGDGAPAPSDIRMPLGCWGPANRRLRQRPRRADPGRSGARGVAPDAGRVGGADRQLGADRAPGSRRRP